MLNPQRIGILFFTTFNQIPIFLKCCALLLLPGRGLFFYAKIAFRVIEKWTWVECFINDHQVLRVVFFLSLHYLSKVRWARDCKRVFCINPHSVQVSAIVYSVNVLGFWHVREKAHSFVKAISASNIFVHHQLVFQKFIQNRTEEFHVCVLPDASFVVQYLMTHYVRN